MQALFWSTVINGLVAVPLMAVIIVLVSRPRSWALIIAPPTDPSLAWLATAVMGAPAGSLPEPDLGGLSATDRSQSFRFGTDLILILTSR